MFLITAISTTAFGQATRTWVSGVGDDANPCSRTAPCKTFAGAISKTAAGGQISVLDPGGFGAVTVTKSITFDGAGTLASIANSGSAGILINGAGIVVTIRNLQIDGGGFGLDGVRILNASAVNIENCYIMNEKGSSFPSPAGVAILIGAKVRISDTQISNTLGSGIRSAPTSGVVLLTVNNVGIFNAGASGIQLTSNVAANIRHSTITNSANAGVQLETGTAEANIYDTVLSMNANGIEALAGAARIYGCTITDNSTNGLRIVGAGVVLTHQNNSIQGNAGNQAPSAGGLGQQ